MKFLQNLFFLHDIAHLAFDHFHFYSKSFWFNAFAHKINAIHLYVPMPSPIAFQLVWSLLESQFTQRSNGIVTPATPSASNHPGWMQQKHLLQWIHSGVRGGSFLASRKSSSFFWIRKLKRDLWQACNVMAEALCTSSSISFGFHSLTLFHRCPF